MQSRVNPQSISAGEYKPAAKPAAISVPTSSGKSTSDNATAVANAEKLLKSLIGVTPMPVRAVVATPVVVKPTTTGLTDNIAAAAAVSKTGPISDVSTGGVRIPIGYSTRYTDKPRTAIYSQYPFTVPTVTVGVDDSAAKLALIRKECAEMARNREEESSANVQLRSDLDEMTAQYIDSEAQRQELAEHVTSLTETNAQLQGKYDAAKAAGRARITQLQGQFDQLTVESDRLTEQISSMSSQVSSCSEYDEILSQLINAQENVDSLEADLALATSKSEKLERHYRQALDASAREIRELTDNVDKKNHRIELLESAVEKLMNTNSTITTESDRKYNDLNTRRNEEQMFATKTLEVHQRKYNELMKQSIDLNNEITRRGDALRVAAGDYEKLNTELIHQRNINVAMQTKHAKLTEAARVYMSHAMALRSDN